MNRFSFCAGLAAQPLVDSVQSRQAKSSLSMRSRRAVLFTQSVDAVMPAASVAKLFIAAALLSSGKNVQDADRTAFYDMLRRSDNDAANALIDKLTIPRLSSFIRRNYRATEIQGHFALKGPLRARTSARDVSDVLVDILGKAKTSELARLALSAMTASSDSGPVRDAFPRGAVVASKLGETETVLNEALIVAPFGVKPLIIVSLSERKASTPKTDVEQELYRCGLGLAQRAWPEIASAEYRRMPPCN